MEPVEVEDLSAGQPVPPAVLRRPPPPRWLTGSVVVMIVAGVLGAVSVHASVLRRRLAEADLTVAVVAARAQPGPPEGDPGEAEATVSLGLRVSVPVRVIDAELDGAPPVTRAAARSAASRTPSLLVHWRVLCAEVGTVPGPRLLDVDLATADGTEHRRVTLATTDDDPISQAFHLAAAEQCD